MEAKTIDEVFAEFEETGLIVPPLDEYTKDMIEVIYKMGVVDGAAIIIQEIED